MTIHKPTKTYYNEIKDTTDSIITGNDHTEGVMKTFSSLEHIAARVRMMILDEIYTARSGHPGGSLSIVEALVYVYEHELRKGVDKFVLSKGHAAPALYAVLALKGYFPEEELAHLRQSGSMLQGHPSIITPGVDMCTGSLGQGLSAACGMALGARYLKQDANVYAIVGDGECQEGQIWEALHFAAHYHLSNLCVMIDWNGLQIEGKVDDVMNLRDMDKRVKDCGFNVITVDGHDFTELAGAFELFHSTADRPTAIILKTVKGKGVSFMENKAEWHGKAPDEEQYLQAVRELKEVLDHE